MGKDLHKHSLAKAPSGRFSEVDKGKEGEVERGSESKSPDSVTYRCDFYKFLCFSSVAKWPLLAVNEHQGQAVNERIYLKFQVFVLY